MNVWSALLLALVCVSCGGSSTAPTPVTPPVTPTPSLATITGHVTATNGGQALGGLTTLLAGHSSTTDGAGTFSVQTTPASSAALLLSGSGIVPRSLNLAALTSHDVAIGAIALGGGFDLTFYRELVRNSFDAPATLEPLRRWTQNPHVYLMTVDDQGAAIDGAQLAATESLTREMIPTWTNHTLSVADLTRGTTSQVGVAGWLTIRWNATRTSGSCGVSQIGQSGGYVELHAQEGGGCSCPGLAVAPRTIRHELGHAMGFWHTDNPGDLMAAGIPGCDAQPSARELAHAAIAYARPVGNLDPDQDPIGVVTLAAKAVR